MAAPPEYRPGRTHVAADVRRPCFRVATLALDETDSLLTSAATPRSDRRKEAVLPSRARVKILTLVSILSLSLLFDSILDFIALTARHARVDTGSSSWLPRLERHFYQADAVVHWTLSVADRATGWLSDPFHASFRELMLHAATREDLFCPAYCLMPDHIHFVWMGLRRDSDQLNAMAFLRTYLEPLLAPQKFQHQPYDHVLRQEERRQDAFATVCYYVLANPERKGLVKRWQEWPYGSAVVPGYPKLHPTEDDFWEKFWKLYYRFQEDIKRT